jgi:hypothetical protein
LLHAPAAAPPSANRAISIVSGASGGVSDIFAAFGEASKAQGTA